MASSVIPLAMVSMLDPVQARPDSVFRCAAIVRVKVPVSSDRHGPGTRNRFDPKRS
jgi:hypothetical protein